MLDGLSRHFYVSLCVYMCIEHANFLQSRCTNSHTVVGTHTVVHAFSLLMLPLPVMFVAVLTLRTKTNSRPYLPWCNVDLLVLANWYDKLRNNSDLGPLCPCSLVVKLMEHACDLGCRDAVLPIGSSQIWPLHQCYWVQSSKVISADFGGKDRPSLFPWPHFNNLHLRKDGDSIHR